MEKQVGKGVVKVLEGDVTKVKVDAIVNSANISGYMQAGVAGGIKRDGGKSIEDEILKQAPLSLGNVYETYAGDLRAKYIIHAVVLGPGGRTNISVIRKATRSALKKADDLRLVTLAFPSLGTNIGGFDVDAAAAVQIEEVVRYLRKAKNLERIAFVLWDAKLLTAYKAALSKTLI